LHQPYRIDRDYPAAENKFIEINHLTFDASSHPRTDAESKINTHQNPKNPSIHMKKINILSLGSAGLMAAAALALLAPSGHAQTVTYAPGDLLFAFEEPGNANNYILDLGPVTEFITLSQTPGTTDLNTLLTLGNIGADLTAAFGSGWATNNATPGTNVQWGAFDASSKTAGGTTGVGGVLGLPKETLFLTQYETSPGGQSNDPAEKSASNQGGAVSLFNSFSNSGFAGQSQTANSTVGTIIASGGINSWTAYNPNGSSTGAFGTGLDVEQDQEAGNAFIGPTNSQLDLYELLPSGATGYTGSGTDLGSFTLTPSADPGGYSLNFTSAASVPEPSTYAAIGLGAAFLVLFRRSRGALLSPRKSSHA
jgi:hypothetical protein